MSLELDLCRPDVVQHLVCGLGSRGYYDDIIIIKGLLDSWNHTRMHNKWQLFLQYFRSLHLYLLWQNSRYQLGFHKLHLVHSVDLTAICSSSRRESVSGTCTVSAESAIGAVLKSDPNISNPSGGIPCIAVWPEMSGFRTSFSHIFLGHQFCSVLIGWWFQADARRCRSWLINARNTNYTKYEQFTFTRRVQNPHGFHAIE